MSLYVGGIVFPATSFSGWYSLPEVAVRDMLDQQRYNLMEVREITQYFREDIQFFYSLFFFIWFGLVWF